MPSIPLAAKVGLELGFGIMHTLYVDVGGPFALDMWDLTLSSSM